MAQRSLWSATQMEGARSELSMRAISTASTFHICTHLLLIDRE